MRNLITLLLLLLLASCSTNATGPLYSHSSPPGTSEAALILYRPAINAGSAWWPNVSIDGKPVVELYNGGYTRVSLTPGPHKILGLGKFKEPYELMVDAKPGSVYYVEYAFTTFDQGKVAMAGGIPVGYGETRIDKIEWVLHPGDTPPAALTTCHYIEPIEQTF